MTLVFFDLDKTILAENSAKLWLKSQWRFEKIKLPQFVMASYWLTKYHLGFTKLDEAIKKSLRYIEGEKQSDICNQTIDFFETMIKQLYRPGALKTIKYHLDLGHKTALLTSSFSELSNLVQQDLGLDYCLCTNLEVDPQGIYTGFTIGPPCFGKNKIIYAQKLCDELNNKLDNCIFYTDSASDIPLMKLVGQPIAVNPDPRLKACAQWQNWPIVDWGRPG